MKNVRRLPSFDFAQDKSAVRREVIYPFNPLNPLTHLFNLFNLLGISPTF